MSNPRASCSAAVRLRSAQSPRLDQGKRMHAIPASIPQLDKETHMVDPVVGRVRTNPKYQELQSKRNRFGWMLAICMMVVYYGYIALIAFKKDFLSIPVGNGVTTLGVPIG